MGRYIARELCDYRINVNVVTPGLTNTPGAPSLSLIMFMLLHY